MHHKGIVNSSRMEVLCKKFIATRFFRWNLIPPNCPLFRGPTVRGRSLNRHRFTCFSHRRLDILIPLLWLIRSTGWKIKLPSLGEIWHEKWGEPWWGETLEIMIYRYLQETSLSWEKFWRKMRWTVTGRNIGSNDVKLCTESKFIENNILSKYGKVWFIFYLWDQGTKFQK